MELRLFKVVIACPLQAVGYGEPVKSARRCLDQKLVVAQLIKSPQRGVKYFTVCHGIIRHQNEVKLLFMCVRERGVCEDCGTFALLLKPSCTYPEIAAG